MCNSNETSLQLLLYCHIDIDFHPFIMNFVDFCCNSLAITGAIETH